MGGSSSKLPEWEEVKTPKLSAFTYTFLTPQKAPAEQMQNKISGYGKKMKNLTFHRMVQR